MTFQRIPDDFRGVPEHFPTISEDFQGFPRDFPSGFRGFRRVPEGFRRCSDPFPSGFRGRVGFFRWREVVFFFPTTFRTLPDGSWGVSEDFRRVPKISGDVTTIHMLIYAKLRIRLSDWSIWVTWAKYCSLIGYGPDERTTLLVQEQNIYGRKTKVCIILETDLQSRTGTQSFAVITWRKISFRWLCRGFLGFML